MDMINYQAIQAMNPWNYQEHHAVNMSIGSKTLITLVDVTGKGFLEEVILFKNYAPTSVEIKITVDGEVVLDLAPAGGISSTVALGLHPHDDIQFQSGQYYLFGVEDLVGGMATDISNNCKPVLFPNSSLQVIDSANGLVSLTNPIYFNESLLIEVSGTAINSWAVARVRY